MNRNFWVERLKIEYYKLPENSNVIISDVRFIHELDQIKNMGGLLIKINRYTTIWDNNDKHISENEMDLLDNNLFDIIIDNNNSKEDLFSNIDKHIFTLLEIL